MTQLRRQLRCRVRKVSELLCEAIRTLASVLVADRSSARRVCFAAHGVAPAPMSACITVMCGRCRRRRWSRLRSGRRRRLRRGLRCRLGSGLRGGCNSRGSGALSGIGGRGNCWVSSRLECWGGSRVSSGAGSGASGWVGSGASGHYCLRASRVVDTQIRGVGPKLRHGPLACAIRRRSGPIPPVALAHRRLAHQHMVFCRISDAAYIPTLSRVLRLGLWVGLGLGCSHNTGV